jgi:dTDP-4-amino-4,6-dideoxygalactose transaminase
MSLIGGFFELEGLDAGGPGVADLWGMPLDPNLTFANGRSALAALVATQKPKKVWLPAYICRSVHAAVLATGIPLAFFPVNADLGPDTFFLERHVGPREMVLAVDYFGRPPTDCFLNFVRRRPDLLFVEDASQAMDTGQPPWGQWRLHSPRKLLGVIDGGFITPATAIDPEWTAQPSQTKARHLAALARFEDEAEADNPHWHGANQSREAAEQTGRDRMSRLSRSFLQHLPVKPMISKRRANFAVLATDLQPLAFLPDRLPSFAPSGFPIQTLPEQRPGLIAALVAQGIFPAVHWTDLPSDPSFALEHHLARTLLTLPCDHRYGPTEMARVADVTLRVLDL